MEWSVKANIDISWFSYNKQIVFARMMDRVTIYSSDFNFPLEGGGKQIVYFNASDGIDSEVMGTKEILVIRYGGGVKVHLQGAMRADFKREYAIHHVYIEQPIVHIKFACAGSEGINFFLEREVGVNAVQVVRSNSILSHSDAKHSDSHQLWHNGN